MSFAHATIFEINGQKNDVLKYDGNKNGGIRCDHYNTKQTNGAGRVVFLLLLLLLCVYDFSFSAKCRNEMQGLRLRYEIMVIEVDYTNKNGF